MLHIKPCQSEEDNIWRRDKSVLKSYYLQLLSKYQYLTLLCLIARGEGGVKKTPQAHLMRIIIRDCPHPPPPPFDNFSPGAFYSTNQPLPLKLGTEEVYI